MKNSLSRQVVVVLATIATVVINILATALPLNGVSTGQLSDAIPTLFTPAGYVFSIWGVIYLGLIAYAIYQARPVARGAEWLEKNFWWYLLASFSNIIWIFLWHYQQVPLSLVAMILLLISLIQIYRNLDIGKYKASVKTRWMVHIPFSIYLGWISVATIANVSAVLYVLEWDGFGVTNAVWSVLMINIAMLLGFLMLKRREDIGYALVLVWAFVGIFSKFQGPEPFVAGSAITASISLAILASLLLLKRTSSSEGQLH